MAVYTQVSGEALADFLTGYDAGTLTAAKGIAEGVENTNYLIETSGGRFILTLYEKRVHAADLPYFAQLLDHVAERGCPVPRMIADRDGQQVGMLAGRPACLIEFLPGVSPTRPTAQQATAAGAALARLHLATADYPGARDNALGPAGWRALHARCGSDLDRIAPGLGTRTGMAVNAVLADWPTGLARGTIHADLFPDNVLMLGERVTGLIDFYFACTDLLAYDLAVMHSAWAFDPQGEVLPGVGDALIAGYESIRPLPGAERDALPLLAKGACLRFLLTRAWDWLNTPADALVTRKDPLAYLKRLDAYEAGQF